MANTTISPNMNLPVPVVGVDPGPAWASDINACLALIDQHTHAAGSGVQINSNGLNINSDLPLNDNNMTLIKSARFQAQSSTLAGVSDLGCLYVTGVDLYFNDVNGNAVRITQSGGVAGSPGSISNLTSPASASYVAANQTFVWQSAAVTPANMDGASYILRNLSANSKGLTLSPPAAMGANYTITLPSLPGSTLPLIITSSGSISASTLIAAYYANNSVENQVIRQSAGLSVIGNAITSTSNVADITGTADQVLRVNTAGTALAFGQVQTAGIADAAITSAKLATAVSSTFIKMWVNFDGTTLTGTYIQSGTTVTATITSHGMIGGQVIYVSITSGTAVTGAYTITSTTTNTFTYTAGTSLSTSGNISRRTCIKASLNVSSVTYISSGVYEINFTNAMTDANYAWSGSAWANGATYTVATYASQNPPMTTTALYMTTITGGAVGGTATIITAMVFGN